MEVKMKTKIYDYANVAVEIEIKDKPIEKIFVEIKSGDEIVTIYYKDGTQDRFDSSNCRINNYDDGAYVVTGENIEKWLNYKPKGWMFADDRQEFFQEIYKQQQE